MRLNHFVVWLGVIFASSLPAGLSLAIAPPALAQPSDASWGLPQLMHALAQVHSASANFTERQTIQMLNAPLLTSGSLNYVAPNYLRKTTTSPSPENFVLDQGMVTLSGGPDHQTQTISIAGAPQIGGLVEGIRATLAGDLPALQRVYSVRLTGTPTNWQLLLQPKDPSVTHFVKWIIIQGKQNRIEAVDTASANGDHSEMGIAEKINDAQ